MPPARHPRTDHRGAALFGAGTLGALLVCRELGPLERVADTAAGVSMLPLDRGEVSLAERVPSPTRAPKSARSGRR